MFTEKESTEAVNVINKLKYCFLEEINREEALAHWSRKGREGARSRECTHSTQTRTEALLGANYKSFYFLQIINLKIIHKEHQSLRISQWTFT